MKFSRGEVVLAGSRGVFVVVRRCSCGSRTCYDLAPLTAFGDLYHQQGSALQRVPRPDQEQIDRARRILSGRSGA